MRFGGFWVGVRERLWKPEQKAKRPIYGRNSEMVLRLFLLSVKVLYCLKKAYLRFFKQEHDLINLAIKT